jgi:class 3 adenylate cyclase/CHASE2 domain-containing sensor protein
LVDVRRRIREKSASFRPLSWVSIVLLAELVALTGYLSDFDGSLSALGGPNGPLYDLTLRLSAPWRRSIQTVPAIFVAVDDASLSQPELAVLPRALFQPVWARLIDGLLASGASRIAFDVVLAYAGSDFRSGSFTLPEYDRGLTESLARGRDRIVLGAFPTLSPAPAFMKAVGTSRVGVLDVRRESDGRVRSTASLARLPTGRIALGFAALAAGRSVTEAAAMRRVLITPSTGLTATPTYTLGTLLGCLSSAQDAQRVRDAVSGRVVVVGTAVIGEDEHFGPTRFFDHPASVPASGRCVPQKWLVDRPETDSVPGALLQIAAIQSAASERPVTIAAAWERFLAGAALALVFGLIALRDETALIIGEHDVSSRLAIMGQVLRSTLSALAGPCVCGIVISAVAFVAFDSWLPMGYPVVATTLSFVAIMAARFSRHRATFRRLYRTAGRYLPPARLAALARTGFADAQDGQEREVSILLVDLVGFTSFANEKERSASEVVKYANRYFTIMQAIIDRYGGCSDKFLGDAVLAFWNGFADEPDHALKAVLAAQEIISTVGHAAGSGGFALEARAVVCSGWVYVGDLGAKDRSNFTIIGPAVNETFRLEKLPDVYGLQLLVAASTHDLIVGSTSMAAAHAVMSGRVFVRIDDVELKGFQGRRSIYALVSSDDPGVQTFEAGRRALDLNLPEEAVAQFHGVSGMLERAARAVSPSPGVPATP